MFLWSNAARLLVVCLDSLVEQGVVTDEQRTTFGSLNRLEGCVGVSKHRKNDINDWLAYNPLNLQLREIFCKPGDWEPLPIAEALAADAIKTSEAVAICGDELEIFEAHALGLGAILLTRETDGPIDCDPGANAGPDFILRAGDDGAKIFADKSPLAGFAGEVVAGFDAIPWLANKVLAERLVFRNEEDEGSPIHVCGRYFKSSDARRRFHPLSLRLINAKNNPERQTGLARQILDFWNRVEGGVSAIFAPIPSRDGKPNISILAIQELRNEKIEPAPDLLRCKYKYSPQKTAGSYEARRTNVSGVFKVTKDVRGKTVVLVDDITTSFATLNEARKVLLEAKAARVIPVALSFHPTELTGGPSLEYPSCTKCGNSMVTRYNRKSGDVFFACSDIEAYQAGESHPPLPFGDVYTAEVNSKLLVPKV